MVRQATLDGNAADGHSTALLQDATRELAPIKVLTITTLYPNEAQPTHGVFVENRLRHLADTGEVRLRVVAPVPWFPWKGQSFGKYGTFARVPGAELRHDIPITHPRYPLIPKVGMTTAPLFLGSALLRHVRSLIAAEGEFNVIDAHFFYPDGVAA